MKLKINRKEWNITKDDLFMDNGACIQVLTKKILHGFHRCSLVLTKKAEKELGGFEKIQQQHNYGSGISIYKLKIEE